MIYIKPGVVFKRFTPEMRRADDVMDMLYAALGFECTITSGNDGTHSEHSLHYSDMAHDYRTHHLKPGQAELIGEMADRALGPDYDILLEDAGEPNEHLHVEFQPKKGKA